MDMVLLDLIEEVIAELEDEQYEYFSYDNYKFHIVDKYNNIDFQAKLGNNNYYFKDNISGYSFVKVKKKINDNTTIQQILIEENDKKCFYSYLEREGYVNLVRVVKTEKDDTLVCNNLNVLNHTWDEIAKYADESFEDSFSFGQVKAAIYLEGDESEEDIAKFEDAIIKKVFNIIESQNVEENGNDDKSEDEEDIKEYDAEGLYDDDEFLPDDENDDEYDYEFNQIDENQEYGLSDIFESNSIHDYETYIERKEECEANGERYDQSEDSLPIGDYSEAIEDYYKDYQLIINGKEIDGQSKCRIIADCEAAVDENAYDSIMFDEAVINLKAVIEALQKQNAFEKNDGFEK